jgi:hypothetical protein
MTIAPPDSNTWLIFIGGVFGWGLSVWQQRKFQKSIEDKVNTANVIRNYQHRQMWAWFRQMKGISNGGEHDFEKDIT